MASNTRGDTSRNAPFNENAPLLNELSMLLTRQMSLDFDVILHLHRRPLRNKRGQPDL